MDFHENLTRARRSCGITQEELAAKLNVSRQAVSKWETGESLPDLYKLAALAAALGTTTDALCGFERIAPEAPAGSEAPAAPESVPAPDERKQIAHLRAALGILLAACIVLTALTARALVRERTYAELLRASEEAVPLPDTVEVSGLALRSENGTLVVSFVPNLTGDGISWTVDVAPKSDDLTVTTTLEGGICTARIASLSHTAPATLSATVTNGKDSRSLCLATQVNVSKSQVSWTPEA